MSASAETVVKRSGAYLDLSGEVGNIINAFEGAQKEYIYFGDNGKMSVVGNKRTGAVRWRVLSTGADNKYSRGNMLLWADYQLATKTYNPYHDNPYYAFWGTSQIRAIMNGGTYYTATGVSNTTTVPKTTKSIIKPDTYYDYLFNSSEMSAIVSASSYITDDCGYNSTTSIHMRDAIITNKLGVNGQYSSTIVTATVPNSGSGIAQYAYKTSANGVQETTSGDNLFLLDYYDINNLAYGFGDDTDGDGIIDKNYATQVAEFANSKNSSYPATWSESSDRYPGYYDGAGSAHNGIHASCLSFSGDLATEYWLRPAGRSDLVASKGLVVSADGVVALNLVTRERGVRPAFNLDASKLGYVTATAPGSSWSDMSAVSEVPAYKAYLKDSGFTTNSSAATVKIGAYGGSMNIKYNNPTGISDGKLLVLLHDIDSTDGAVAYQTTISMNSSATRTNSVMATLGLPAGVTLDKYKVSLLYTSDNGDNSTEIIYCSYPTDQGIEAPTDIVDDDMVYDGSSNRWIDNLGEYTPDWLDLQIYNNPAYMSVDSIIYQDNLGSVPVSVGKNEIINAGIYTVAMKLADGVKWSDGTKDNKTFNIVIAKARPNVEVQTVGTLPTYAPDELEEIIIECKSGGTDGTVEWKAGQTPQVGENVAYTWVFIPAEPNNYEVTEGTISLTFKAREIERVDAVFTPTGDIFTNTSEATLRDWTIVTITYKGTPVKTEVTTNYEFIIDNDGVDQLIAGDNYFIVRVTDDVAGGKKISSDPPVKISGVKELGYSSVSRLSFDTKTFTYPVTAEEIIAAIKSATLNRNDGHSDDVTTTEDIKKIIFLADGADFNAGTGKSFKFKLSDTDEGIVYSGFTINKGTYDMTGVSLTGETTVTYDGNSHALTLSKEPPAGVSYTIKYNGETTAPTDAGTYTVTVSFTGDYDNYNTIADMTATLVINKAAVEGITFASEVKPEITGTSYTLEAAGVPEWITVAYSVEGQGGLEFSAAGSYKFTATFTINDPEYAANYETPVAMTATLTISDKPPVEGAENIVVQPTITVTYTGLPVDYAATNVPEGVEISYVIEKDGEPFEGDITDAGVYTVTVSFDTGVDKAPIADKTCVITVAKATYDLGVTFAGATVAYDGENHTIEIAGELPDWITVSYEVAGQEGVEFSAVGTYEFTAKFAHDDPNYEQIADMTATLKITTASAEMSVTFKDKTVTYDGENHTLVLGGNLPTWASVEYYCNGEIFTGAVDAGTYEITAKFTVDLSLYEQPDDMTATLKISPADYDMTGVTFESATVAYDGEAHSIFVGGAELPEWITVTYEGNGITEIGAHTVTAKFSHTNGNYGSIGDMTAQIEIFKAKIAVPVYNNSLSYTGASVTPTGANFTGFDAEIMTLVAEKTVSGLSAGSYKAVIKLNDPTKYEWVVSAFKKSLFAVALFDEEIALAAGETAVDWSLARAKITATPKAELAAGALPEFASESYIGELGEVLTLKYYTDKECKQEIAADELGYETTYYVKVALLDNDNFELESSAMEYSLSSVAYTTPAKELTFWEKVVVFLKANWLWLVIALVALIVLITIIACCARASKKKKARIAEEKAEKLAREEREREERRLEREERMARLSQQQSAPAPQYIPQPMLQFAPQMPMQSMGGAMSGGNGGGASSNEIAELKAEMAAMKAAQDNAKEIAELKAEQAAMKAEQSAKESAGQQISQSKLETQIASILARLGGETTVANSVSLDKLTEIVRTEVNNALAGKVQPAQQTNGDSTQVPPDAVMTTVTTTKIDTTKKTAQNGQEFDRDRSRSTRSFVAPMPVDDGRVFDVGGFYKPADPSDFADPDEEGK